MELWIRSQDKKVLKKINDIEIDYLDFEKYHYVKDIESKGEYSIRGNGETLGQYETEERALEVLNEIQKLIQPTFITTGYDCKCKENPFDKLSFNLEIAPTKIEVKELLTYVYEMPEE